MDTNTNPTPAGAVRTVLSDSEVVSRLISSLTTYKTDVVERNNYIDKRDRYLYGDGLFEEVSIPDGYDMTMYNYLRPITQIHASQLMQEQFGVYSHWDAIDPDTNAEDPKAKEMALLNNKAAETKSWAKKELIDAMIRDNGGFKTFVDGAQTGSDYGSTLFQLWYDPRESKIKYQLIESIQNWFPLWADDNFRERVGDAYVTQLAPVLAYQRYGHKLGEGESFATSMSGEPLTTIQGTTSTLSAQAGQTVSGSSTHCPMVTRVNYTGYLDGVCYEDGSFYICEPGDETMLSFESIGQVIVAQITEPKKMPKFYYIPNSTVPRRPYGESDLPESALQINGTIIQTKSNQLTRAAKIIFPIIQALGFENGTIPPRNQNEITIIPMSRDQEFKPVVFNTQDTEHERIIGELTHDLLQVCRVPRVLFDDPSVTLNSNQALLTSLRPMTDVVVKKQKNWEPVITQMFSDALNLAAEYDDSIRQLIEEDVSYLYMRWPSVLRKDDPAHQTMLINDLHAGMLSPLSYMERRGETDPQEELTRIKTAMEDGTQAAMMSGSLGTLAHYSILKHVGLPLWGTNLPKVTLRGEIAPQEVGNMGHEYGWDQGPYGPAIGPAGLPGVEAADTWLNGGMIGAGSAVNPTEGPGGPGQPSAPTQPMPGGSQPAPMRPAGAPSPGAQPMSMPGTGGASNPMARAGRR